MDIFKDYEVEGQLSIFDLTLPVFKIDKPIRLIELFAGVGSQAMALRDLGADFKHYRVVEFDKYAIASYNAIHGTDFPTMDITKVNGEDLGIVDTEKYCYIMTYSFPCQDLSVAGKQAGMQKGSGTRSGLLWEVERLLNEVDNLPQVLLMENVPQVRGEGNKKDFQSWIDFLASKGYSNYWQDLNAKNYGVAQNRDRCFMVSILGEWNYRFPNPIPLTKTMKDYLENEVEEKYYINNEKAQKLIDTLISKGICNTLTSVQKDNLVMEPVLVGGIGEKWGDKQYRQGNRVYDSESVAMAVTSQPLGNMGGNSYMYLTREPQYRIRKLTPRECWRLMDFTDEDFEKAAQVNSNTQLYKQAGNSIVRNVLVAILGQMIPGRENLYMQ